MRSFRHNRIESMLPATTVTIGEVYEKIHQFGWLENESAEPDTAGLEALAACRIAREKARRVVEYGIGRCEMYADRGYKIIIVEGPDITDLFPPN